MHGDLWVVMSCDGRFWNGEAWVGTWQEARHLPAYDKCQVAAAQVRKETGVACLPRYVRLNSRKSELARSSRPDTGSSQTTA